MRSRRRLLIVSQPVAEGVPQHVLDVLPFVDLDEYEVDIACPPVSTLWRALDGDDRFRLHPITSARSPAPDDLPSLARLLRLASRADVIHAHSSKAGFLGRLAAMLAGQAERCIFTPHAWSFWAVDGVEAQAYARFERLAARWCRTIMVVAEAEREAGLAAGVGRPAQYRVVPNGVDLDRFSAPRAPVAGRTLFLGRLAAQKRPDVALAVAARLRERVEGFELHFVGDGPLRAETERLAAARGLGDCVRFLGNRADVPALLAGAACLLLTSDYEGCPMSVLEALAAGVPVVATRVGGVPELVSDQTGALAERGDVESLAAAVERVLDDPDAAATLGENARSDARARFSRERMAADVLELYAEAAAARRGMTAVKARVPWPAKVAAKLLLARLPVAHGFWRRLSLFQHGRMDDAPYALGVFELHRRPELRAGFVALELGPGDTVSSAVIGRALGASKTYLVDVAPFARRELGPYRELAGTLLERGLAAPPLDDLSSFEELLERCHADYRTNGLDSLRELADGSVDVAWSHAVLEHVRRDEFLETMRELRRVLRPDGYSSHRVDLRDHLADALNNLRFPERLWESELIARSGLYTNRIRCSEMLDLFRAAGFEIADVETWRWPDVPTPRSQLGARYRGLSDDDLRVYELHVVLRPTPLYRLLGPRP